jgi:hypothetical protein
MDVHKSLPTVTNVDEFFKLVEKTMNGLSLPSTIVTLEKTSDLIAQIQGPDLSGIAAVVGGILAQDVLNVLAGKEPPLKNWLIFDGNSCTPSPHLALTPRRRKDFCAVDRTEGREWRQGEWRDSRSIDIPRSLK